MNMPNVTMSHLYLACWEEKQLKNVFQTKKIVHKEEDQNIYQGEAGEEKWQK